MKVYPLKIRKVYGDRNKYCLGKEWREMKVNPMKIIKVCADRNKLFPGREWRS